MTTRKVETFVYNKDIVDDLLLHDLKEVEIDLLDKDLAFERMDLLKQKYKYYKGNRNNLAVDLTILCFIANIDPDIRLMEFMPETANPGEIAQALYDYKERRETIVPYIHGWLYDYSRTTPDVKNLLGYLTLD